LRRPSGNLSAASVHPLPGQPLRASTPTSRHHDQTHRIAHQGQPWYAACIATAAVPPPADTRPEVVYERTPGAAGAPLPPAYRPRHPSTPPPVAPARSPSQPTLLPDDELDQTDPFDEAPSDAAAELDLAVAAPRAPP
jgi:hypothetical protein